jgi:hypothetical protein
VAKHYLKKETLCKLVFTTCLAGALILLRTNVSNIHIKDATLSVIIDAVDLVKNVHEKPEVPIDKQRLGNVLTNVEPHIHLMDNNEIHDYDSQQANSPVHDGYYLHINVTDIIYIVGYIIFVLTALSSGILIKFKQRPSDD